MRSGQNAHPFHQSLQPTAFTEIVNFSVQHFNTIYSQQQTQYGEDSHASHESEGVTRCLFIEEILRKYYSHCCILAARTMNTASGKEILETPCLSHVCMTDKPRRMSKTDVPMAYQSLVENGSKKLSHRTSCRSGFLMHTSILKKYISNQQKS